MNAYQPRTAPSYAYDITDVSFQRTGAPILGYDFSANYIPPISLEISLRHVAKYRQFTGKERDSESGLDYFGARYYGSALGRFTSPDKPFADQHITNPQSWNLYAYVRNNPLSIVDPNGTSAQAIELGAWQATHEPQIAAAAEALMAAHHGYTLSKAIQELFSPQSPSEKIKAALGSTDAGTVIEGIVAEHVREHFNGFLGLGEGDLVDVQVDVPNPDNPGELSTELDIQLTFAVVEVKSGTNALTHNLDKKQKFGLPVVVYAPRANGLQQRQIFSAGAIWVWISTASWGRWINSRPQRRKRSISTLPTNSRSDYGWLQNVFLAASPRPGHCESLVGRRIQRQRSEISRSACRWARERLRLARFVVSLRA